MIEVTILNYLKDALEHPIFMEEPIEEEKPSHYYLMEKTGSSQNDMLYESTFAIQSLAPTMADAAGLNDTLKRVMIDAITLSDVTRVRLNSDYNYTDTQMKRYRYQAVFDLVHYF